MKTTLHSLNKAFALTLLLSTAMPMFAAWDKASFATDFVTGKVKTDSSDKDKVTFEADEFKLLITEVETQVKDAKDDADNKKDAEKLKKALELIQKETKETLTTVKVVLTDAQQKELDALFPQQQGWTDWAKDNKIKTGLGATALLGTIAGGVAYATGMFDEVDEEEGQETEVQTTEVNPTEVALTKVVTDASAAVKSAKTKKAVVVTFTGKETAVQATVADLNNAITTFVKQAATTKTTHSRRGAKSTRTNNFAKVTTALKTAHSNVVKAVNTAKAELTKAQTPVAEEAQEETGVLAIAKKHAWKIATGVAAVTGIVVGEMLRNRGYGVVQGTQNLKHNYWTAVDKRAEETKNDKVELKKVYDAKIEELDKRITTEEEAAKKATS